MKLRLLLLSLLTFTLFNNLLAAPPAYIKLPDGVIVFTDSLLTGATNAVKLEVVSDDIIRVIAAPGKELTSGNSLITVYRKKPGLSRNAWEGSLSSYLSGVHQFRLTYGGSLKVWLDGKLVLDRWRKAKPYNC